MQLGTADPGTGGRLLLFLADGLLLTAIAWGLRETVRQLSAARAEAELEHGRTALLQDLTARLASQSDAATIAHDVLTRSSELVGCDRGWIVVEDGSGIRVLGALDATGAHSSVGDDTVAATLAARAIMGGEELWIEAGTEAHDRLVAEHPAGFGASAAIAAVPLVRGDGSPFGALLLGWRTDHAFKPANRDLKRAVARITAQALERAELYAKQAEELKDLAQRDEVREAYFAVLSHELRTPVTTIFGASALLARSLDREEAAALVVDIGDEAERLRRIVDDLMVLSRSERGSIEVAPEPMLLQRAVKDILDDIGRRYRHADLRYDAPAWMSAVVADPTALVQVVHNLVTNAIKYAGNDGPIEVSIHEDPGSAVITVEDRGPGLGEQPAEVFGLFHRADHTKKRASGTGIGLYVARELVRAMGGEIGGSNRAGGGASFRFTLPLAEAAGLDGDVDEAARGAAMAPMDDVVEVVLAP
jgi:K+-sensing histidine kinase KdpD